MILISIHDLMVTNKVILYNTFSFDCKPTNFFTTTILNFRKQTSLFTDSCI